MCTGASGNLMNVVTQAGAAQGIYAPGSAPVGGSAPVASVDPAVLMARSNIQAAAATAKSRVSPNGSGASDNSTDNSGAKVLLGT